jgi:Uma2 family endonuclease
MAAPAPNLSPLVRRYSLDELWELDPPADGGRWELIGGVLFMAPAPKMPQSMAASNLNRLLSHWERTHADRARLFIPTTAIWKRPDTWLEPDLFLVSRERLATMRDGITTADLVVEILSPSTAIYDRTTKADTYAALGVRELWLIDPAAQTIEQRVLQNDRLVPVAQLGMRDTLASTAFPGLAIAVADAFATD